MKKFKIYLVLFYFSVVTVNTSLAQTNDNITVDMLKAPSSPAFILLGISPTDIQKPADPTSLYMDLQNATNDFSNIPKDFSLQIAPVSFFGKIETFDDYFKSTALKASNNLNSLGHIIAQTFTISFGLHTPDSTKPLEEAAMGISFSLFRNKVNDKSIKAVKDYKNALANYSISHSALVDSLINNDAGVF